MTDEQIRLMVDRFLGWPLPRDFRPDDGISFVRTHHDTVADRMPTGTNVLDANQAEAMVRYMVEGLPEQIEETARVMTPQEEHDWNLRATIEEALQDAEGDRGSIAARLIAERLYAGGFLVALWLRQ